MRIAFGVTPQLPRSHHIFLLSQAVSSVFVPMWLQVMGIPHSFAILFNSWASSVCLVSRVSAAWLDLVSDASPIMLLWAHVDCVAMR